MADEQAAEALRALLAETAHAHHEATGGVNNAWADWYADYMSGRLGDIIGFEPDVTMTSAWLTAADERHKTEEPDVRYWPTLYARYILEDYAPNA